MNLTPKPSTPWQALLRCCHPSKHNDQDETSTEKDSDHRSTSDATNTPRTECSGEYANVESPQLSPTNLRKATLSLYNIGMSRKESVVTPQETLAPIPEDDGESIDEPSLSRGIPQEESKFPMEISFLHFLFLMMLRNIVGMDYLSDRVKLRPRKLLLDESASATTSRSTEEESSCVD